MNKLQFNISCNTAEEAISEVQKLEKAFNKPIECYVNIVMDEEKEPTTVTVDSEKIVLGNWTKEQIDSTKLKMEKAMRPKRYPYRQKEPTELTVDPKKIITNQINANDIASQSLVIKNKNSEITFSGTKVEIKAQSITGV